MEEIWKQVPFDNRYAVSNKGNVKSFVYGKEMMLKPVLHQGYPFIRIKRKMCFVHRLVALVFIPTNDTTLHIDHIDGDRTNNNVSNLRWCTQKENNNNPVTRHRISIALTGTKRTDEQRKRMSAAQQKAKPFLGKKHSKETLEKFKRRRPPMLDRTGKDNPKSKSVAMLDDMDNIVKIFDCSLTIQQELGIARESISRCCTGKQKTAGGFKWRYLND